MNACGIWRNTEPRATVGLRAQFHLHSVLAIRQKDIPAALSINLDLRNCGIIAFDLEEQRRF